MIILDNVQTDYMNNGRDKYWNHTVDEQADLIVIIAALRNAQTDTGFTGDYNGVGATVVAAVNAGWYLEKIYMLAVQNPTPGSHNCHTWIGNATDYVVSSMSFISTDRIATPWANGGGQRSWLTNPSRVLTVDGYSSLRIGATTSAVGTSMTYTPTSPVGFTTLVDNYKPISCTLHVTMHNDILDPDDSTFTWLGNQGNEWQSFITAEFLHGVQQPPKMIYRI